MTYWYIVIRLISAIDGTDIGEVYSPYSMPVEACVEAIFGEASQAQDGIVTVYECHKSEDISA